MANNPNAKDNLQPFKKGDPRINRNGRPKTFDAWRKLLQSIMDEPATDGKGDPIIIGADKDGNGGHIATNAEMFARDWMKDRKGRRDFAANVYGKPKEEIDLSNTDGTLQSPVLPDEERLARMKQLAAVIAEEIKKDD
jgi:hypothetical protein